jgi:hypothetical protein
MEAAGQLAPLSIREAIDTFKRGLMASGVAEGQEMCDLRHTFVNGVYAREITMLEGQTIVGKIHRHAHLNFIMQGRVKVLTEHEGVKEYSAPCMFVSQPGTQRLVHILEDCVWVTIHEVQGEDLSTIEESVVAKDYADIELVGEFSEVLE